MNFYALIKSGGTFTADEKTFSDYLDWLKTSACDGCGMKYADRPRDENGKCTDTWVTEIECLSCFNRRKKPAPENKFRGRATENKSLLGG